MTIVFGTLGFTPKKLVPTLTRHDNVSKLVFFHDHHDRSKEAAAAVRSYCHEKGIDTEGKEVDAYDILQCAQQMRRELRKYPTNEIVFNLTGGTPVISSAATLICILEGIRAVYIDERSGEEIALPLLTMRYDEVLNKEQRLVLRFIWAAKNGCTQAQIKTGLKLARATVSHHVQNLKKKQLLRAEKDPDDARKETLFVMPSAALLLEDTP